MASIIKLFDTKHINYTASASSALDNTQDPYIVFVDNWKFYKSSNDSPDQWWKISFSIPVALTSYDIFDKAGGNYMTKWNVSCSFDDKEYTTIQTDTDIKNHVVPYTLVTPCYCKFFRITQVENTAKDNFLYFTFISFYGIIDRRFGKTCNFNAYRMNLISHALTFVMSLVISH